MAFRNIGKTPVANCNGHKVFLAWDRAHNEFRCRLTVYGVPYEPADYFTDDKEDALKTAQTMAERSWMMDPLHPSAKGPRTPNNRPADNVPESAWIEVRYIGLDKAESQLPHMPSVHSGAARMTYGALARWLYDRPGTMIASIQVFN